MAKRLAVDGAVVFKVRVREGVSSMCEIMSAAGRRNRIEDYDRLRKMRLLHAVRVDDVYHLVGLPGIRPLSGNCLEVVGLADSSIVVEADPERGFVSRRV